MKTMNFIIIYTASKITVRELKWADQKLNLNVINNWLSINNVFVDIEFLKY